MKPCMHLVEISIFFTKSCHRQTYQNYEQPPRKFQTLYSQSHFFVLKIGQIIPKQIFYEESLTGRPTFENSDFLDTVRSPL